MKYLLAKYSLPQFVLFILFCGMFIVYLHDACVDNYRKLSDDKVISDDLKNFSPETNIRTTSYLYEKNKKKKLNNLISLLYQSSLSQEEYEKNNQEPIVNNSSNDVAADLELFDI